MNAPSLAQRLVPSSRSKRKRRHSEPGERRAQEEPQLGKSKRSLPMDECGRVPEKTALGVLPVPRTPCSPHAPRTLVSTSARQSLRNWSKSPWLLRWFTIMATSCGSPAPAPAPPAAPAPGPAPGPGGGGGGCGCGGGGGGAGGGGCGCGLVAMEAWAGEGAGPGGRALLGGGGCTGPAAWGKPTGCCYGTSGSRATPEVKGNQGKRGKGGDNSKESAATGAARGQFRPPAGALARPGCGGSGGDKAERDAGSGPKAAVWSPGWWGVRATWLPGPGGRLGARAELAGCHPRWCLGLTLLLLFHGAVEIHRHKRTVGGTAYLNSPNRLRSRPMIRPRSFPSR